MHINKLEIDQLDKRYRTAFINSLAGFRQAVLIGTRSVDEKNNLAMFNSLIHLGAHPALYGLMSRPDSVQRDTLQNILETKEYTLNFIQSSQYKKAHQTSARYDKGISEFEKVGFTPFYPIRFPCSICGRGCGKNSHEVGRNYSCQHKWHDTDYWEHPYGRHK